MKKIATLTLNFYDDGSSNSDYRWKNKAGRLKTQLAAAVVSEALKSPQSYPRLFKRAMTRVDAEREKL